MDGSSASPWRPKLALVVLLLGCSTDPTFVDPPSGSSVSSASSGSGGMPANGGAGPGGGAVASVGSGGTAGSGGAPSCPGNVHGGHCYVDITTATSRTWTEAVTDCDAYGVSIGSSAHLVVTGDLDEDDFVVFTFLKATQRTQDAWIGLQCDMTLHPDDSECFCTNGCTDPTETAMKRANWTRIDRTPSLYDGWSAQDPNGDGRCGALTFAASAWGWGDRDCASATFTPMMGVPRSYRTICEIE